MIRDFHQFLTEEKDVPDPGKAADWIWDNVKKKKEKQGGLANQPPQKPLKAEDDFLP